MFHNPNGRLAVYANTMGTYFARRIVDELNILVDSYNAHLGSDGNSEPFLEDRVELKVPKVEVFPDGFLNARLLEKVSGEDAFLVQWFGNPPGVKHSKYTPQRNKEEFFHTIDALFNARVKRLSLVTPLAYNQRKDRREGRDTVGAMLFCKELGGVTMHERMRAFCLDLHAQQCEGFYSMANVHMDSVPMFATFVNYLRSVYPELLDNAVIVMPDVGSAKRGRAYSRRMGLPIVAVDKDRISHTETRVEALARRGLKLKGRIGLLFDDVLSSGGTAGDASRCLINERGVSEMYWFLTHPQITDLRKLDAMYKERLFVKIFTADTVRIPDRPYFEQVPVSALMAKLIFNVHTDQSISDYL